MTQTEKGEIPVFPSAPFWAFLLAAINTLFFCQGIRDILISRDMEIIMPLIYVLMISPPAAIVLTYLWKPGVSIAAGALAACAGRLLLFSPSVAHYYAGEYLIFSGFALFFVGIFSCINVRSLPDDSRSAGAAFAAAGMIVGAGVQLFIRQIEPAYSLPLMAILCALDLFAAVAWLKIRIKYPKTENPQPASGSAHLKTLALLLIGIPFHFIFVVFCKPEFLASRCALPYRAEVLVVLGGLAAAALLAVKWESAGTSARKAAGILLLIGNILTSLYFLFLYNLGEGAWQAAAVFIAAAVVGLDLCRIASYAVSQRSGFLTVSAGIGAAGIAFGVFVVDAGLLLENHLPMFHGFLMLPLIAFSLLTAWSGLPRGEKRKTSGISAWPAAIVSLAPVIGMALFLAPAPRPDADPLVFASLYTWWGTPDGTFGRTFGGVKFEKEGGIDDFLPEVMNMQGIMSGGGGPGLYRATGRSAPGGLDTFSISFDLPSALLHGSPVTYITLRYELDKPTDRLMLKITDAGKGYRVELPKFTSMDTIRLEWPADFAGEPSDRKLPENVSHLSIYLQGKEKGLYTITIDYVRFSAWRHYNEDYRAYYDKKKKLWYNNPPLTQATAHHPYYDGTPWTDIKPYSPKGCYDSLDPDVMTSQLQLMARAGIDVVLFMHPHSPDTIKMGMDIIREKKLPLKVSWYWVGKAPKELIDALNGFGGDPLFLKVGNSPVVVVGRTGLREKPYAEYMKFFKELRRAGVFAIGDSYAPPKEEMLDLLGGHYYYDTTGMYRSRWGGRNIDAAKPDGTFVNGYGHLFTIFDATARLTRSHGGIFLATVIPGFDNLSVHGFNNTPLYDGRPGTVVRRHKGKTYDETWQAAIDAGADWICIVSWNELHEGTEIEPTREDGVFYIEKTRVWSNKFHALRGGK